MASMQSLDTIRVPGIGLAVRLWRRQGGEDAVAGESFHYCKQSQVKCAVLVLSSRGNLRHTDHIKPRLQPINGPVLTNLYVHKI